ncbi:MAG: translocation and assembly module TamA [Candidatus Azotimanducaceae bacterium]
MFYTANSQELELKIVPKDSLNNLVLKSIDYTQIHLTEKSLISEIDSVSFQLQKRGYLNNHLEEFKQNDSIYTAHYIIGDKTDLLKVYYDTGIIPKDIIRSRVTTINEEYFTTTIDQVSLILNEIVNYLESNGNTFVEVSLKNLITVEVGFEAKLSINNLKNRSIDNIVVKGYSKFPKSFIKHYLNLQKGTIFNSNKITQISDAINSLEFVSEIKPPEILFTKDSTSIYLYLQKNKSNVFDGLIGFSTNEKGKLEFNGHFDLALNNAFNGGESIAVKWKSNGEDQKLFSLKLETPFIFNSNITPEMSFDIYKQDTTFLNTKASIDLKYILNPQTIVAAKYQSENSNDLTTTDSQSSIREFKNNFYGVSFEKNIFGTKRDYQNKFFFRLDAIWGNRTLISESLKTDQSKYELTTYYNWSLNQKNSIFIQNHSALLISDELFTNELFRIGGTNSIRGFNEQSIFTSSHTILNLEYRYHLYNSSYLFSITDFAYINNDLLNNDTQLYSFGIGYEYKLKNGVINLSYALGKEADIPIDIDNSRFHIKFFQFF